MLLKHRAKITPTDLPYIESPLFSTNCRKDESQCRRVAARVENGEIVLTGRETRRTDPIKSSDAARNEARFCEMRVGDYQLEFKNDKKTLDEALSLRLIKAKRS